MDHPILSIDEFVRHFRFKAEEFGYESVELLELRPTESAAWSSTRAAFGVVINGEVIIGNRLETQVRCTAEEFELLDAEGLHVLAGPDGARLVMARRGPLSDAGLTF